MEELSTAQSQILATLDALVVIRDRPEAAQNPDDYFWEAGERNLARLRIRSLTALALREGIPLSELQTRVDLPTINLTLKQMS